MDIADCHFYQPARPNLLFAGRELNGYVIGFPDLKLELPLALLGITCRIDAFHMRRCAWVDN